MYLPAGSGIIRPDLQSERENFCGLHYFIPTSGSTLPRRLWASGRHGAARLDLTGVSPRAQCFQCGQAGGAEPREWRTRRSQVLQRTLRAQCMQTRRLCGSPLISGQAPPTRRWRAMRAGQPAPLRAGHACAPLLFYARGCYCPNAIELRLQFRARLRLRARKSQSDWNAGRT